MVDKPIEGGRGADDVLVSLGRATGESDPVIVAGGRALLVPPAHLRDSVAVVLVLGWGEGLRVLMQRVALDAPLANVEVEELLAGVGKGVEGVGVGWGEGRGGTGARGRGVALAVLGRVEGRVNIGQDRVGGHVGTDADSIGIEVRSGDVLAAPVALVGPRAVCGSSWRRRMCSGGGRGRVDQPRRPRSCSLGRCRPRPHLVRDLRRLSRAPRRSLLYAHWAWRRRTTSRAPERSRVYVELLTDEGAVVDRRAAAQWRNVDATALSCFAPTVATRLEAPRILGWKERVEHLGTL